MLQREAFKVPLSNKVISYGHNGKNIYIYIYFFMNSVDIHCGH